MGVGIGIGIGVVVEVGVGADCSVCFSRGGVPCITSPVQQCMSNPPLHAGGFFGKRGSVSASQCVPSIAMEGQFSLACWRFLQPV